MLARKAQRSIKARGRSRTEFASATNLVTDPIDGSTQNSLAIRILRGLSVVDLRLAFERGHKRAGRGL